MEVSQLASFVSLSHFSGRLRGESVDQALTTKMILSHAYYTLAFLEEWDYNIKIYYLPATKLPLCFDNVI